MFKVKLRVRFRVRFRVRVRLRVMVRVRVRVRAYEPWKLSISCEFEHRPQGLLS